MNDKDTTIETRLSHASFRDLSTEEKERAWITIAAEHTNPGLFPLTTKPMISILVAVALALGVGGTVVTADNAKPGDTLFGVDRAVENIRLKLSDNEKKNELRVKFAQERLDEIKKISAKESIVASADVTDATVSEIEADAFTNETIVKIELKDSRTISFSTDAKTEDTVVSAIMAKYSALTKAFIESKLNFEVEDRASRPDDKRDNRTVVLQGELSDEEKANVNTGISAAISILAGVSASLDSDEAATLKLVTDELNGYLTNLPDDAFIQLSDDKFRIRTASDADVRTDVKVNEHSGKTKIDLRTEDGRIRIEIRDGETRIKTQENGRKDDKRDDDAPSSINALEIEADIFTNETVIKVELNDKKTTFTSSADTRTEIIAAVKARYPSLTEAQIDAALDVDVEDRASLLKDVTNLLGDDSDDDNSGSGKRGRN